MPAELRSAANVKAAVPFFAVSNIEASLRFYTDGLGFEKTKEWIDDGRLRWCWLTLGGAAIMLQEYRTSGLNARSFEEQRGSGVSICFQCEDAPTIYRDMIAKGIPASRPFVGNEMWVTSVSDPDGYRLEFESVTDVAEETILEE